MTQASLSGDSGDIICPENSVSAVRNTLLMFRNIDALLIRNASNTLRYPSEIGIRCNSADLRGSRNSLDGVDLRNATQGGIRNPFSP